jgi:hypothetical protein
VADPTFQTREEGLHILRHSLGLNYGREPYRNHFVTGEGSTDYPHCKALVEAGLMTRQKGGALTGGDDVFFVTDAGKQIALASLQKLTPAQKRYRDWLDVSDATGESFGQYIRRVTLSHHQKDD